MTKKTLSKPKLQDNCYLIDTHCHLDMKNYSSELQPVLQRAASSGVAKIVSIGIDYSSSIKAIELARRYTEIWATIGTHPHDVDNCTLSDYQKFEQLYHDNRKFVVGYGEIGLDYVKKYSAPENQKKHFQAQLELAHILQLPVIIHNREADDDTLKITRNSKPFANGGIMHCFSGDYSFAKKVIDLGLLISIPGIVTFKNATVLHEVARKIPLSSMVLETDGPFLAPHPFRGKRNEPSYILYTAAKIAELRNISVEEVALQTSANAEKLFHLNT